MRKYQIGSYEYCIYKTKPPALRSSKTGKEYKLETILEVDPSLKEDKLVKRCEYCNKYFIAVNKRKYCSDDCYSEAKRLREAKRDLRNTLAIKHQKETILREHKQNVGYIPDGFNQIDDPNRLGEVDIYNSLTPNDNGSYDWDKESKLIRKLRYDLYKDNYVNE